MLTHHDGSAPLGSRGAFENTLHLNYTKRYPAYGKQLEEIRRKGKIPELRVIVTTDWKLGGAFPRIVITEQIPVNQLIFDYLTGLSVQIVHHEGEEELVDDLTDAILKVKPKTLVSFNIDAAKQGGKQSAFSLIHPEVWEVLS